LKIGLLKSKQAFYTNIPKVPLVLKKNGDKHGDPFDLLIISQALSENLPVLSSDEYFPAYVGLTIIK
jgi:PIN domain nuclease of toxin-antitoxin system